MSYKLKFASVRVPADLRRLRADESGAAAVIMALVFPVLIGGMAIGAEAGYSYYNQRKLQHAADVAVHAAGVRKRSGDSQAGLESAAVQVAVGSGFIPAKDATGTKVTNLTVNNPPKSGSLAGKPEAVEVILSETRPRMLSSIFSDEPVRIQARAVARLQGGSPACVLALSGTKSRAVEVSGSSSATLNGCSVAANSVQSDAYYMPNSTAYLSADCISTVGGASIKNPTPGVLDLKTCDKVQETAPKTPDPYAAVPEPSVPATCGPATSLKDTIIGPDAGGVKCFSGLSLSGRVEFKPGLYIINGGKLSMTGGEIHGTGVTFFFANQAVAELKGNPLIKLSAPAPANYIPATEPYSGLLFFGARCNLDPTTCDEVFIMTGSSGSNIQGALYLPGSSINFLGNSETATGCLQIIADKVTFTGNSTVTMGSACDTAGTKKVLVGQVVKIAE